MVLINQGSRPQQEIFKFYGQFSKAFAIPYSSD